MRFRAHDETLSVIWLGLHIKETLFPVSPYSYIDMGLPNTGGSVHSIEYTQLRLNPVL